jgi:speckle-type POZ protein
MIIADVGSVATILMLAEQHHCNGHKKACLHSHPENRRAFVASDGFGHLSASCPSITKELILQ